MIKDAQMRFVILLLFLTMSLPCLAVSDWQDQIRALVKNGGVYAESEDGQALFALNADTAYIPASTLKIATASAGLDLLGGDYRFPTDFYLDENQNLWIKGYGDPLLISEELALIAARLRDKKLTRVNRIYLDDSFFSPNIEVPGASHSLNPYDAKNGALFANFNTLYVIKTKAGTIASAEPQTPMTALTERFAKSAPRGKSRINLAQYPDQALLYVGHLMKAFLNREDIAVAGEILPGRVPEHLPLLYRHLSTKTLIDVVKSLLEFSTNFTANQLYLHMGAQLGGAPASLDKSKRLMKQYLRDRIGLKKIDLEEGSGLSRKNAVTPREMVQLLHHFAPHYTLLKEKNGVWAKTGTLNGVSALAGYFRSHDGLVRFVILLNQGSNHRDRIVKALQQGLGK